MSFHLGLECNVPLSISLYCFLRIFFCKNEIFSPKWCFYFISDLFKVLPGFICCHQYSLLRCGWLISMSFIHVAAGLVNFVLPKSACLLDAVKITFFRKSNWFSVSSREYTVVNGKVLSGWCKIRDQIFWCFLWTYDVPCIYLLVSSP